MPRYTVEKMLRELNRMGKSIKWSRIGLLWLSYKPNIADKRESPSLVMKTILEKDYLADLFVFDPFFLDDSSHTSLVELCEACEVLLLATNHAEFVDYDYLQHKNLMLLVDGMNCLDKESFDGTHISYVGVGR